MSLILNRRRLIQVSSSALILGALNSTSGPASAQSSKELRVTLYGGDTGKANIEAYVKPFQTSTGINVSPITDDATLSQIELMVTTKNVTVDVCGLDAVSAHIAASKGYLEEIDYSIYKKENIDGLVEICRKPFGVSGLFYSVLTFYNTEKFKAGGPQPTSWADLWDVAKFPGIRTLESGAWGTEGPWEEALLADGVAPDALYPMDVDRVFASLDKIKPHVRKWWESGSENQQMIRDQAAELGSCYDGRAQVLIDEGVPIAINRNRAKLFCDYWVIPKGSPNVQNAQKFIEFATRADRQAEFGKLVAFGPTNLEAYKMMPQEVGAKLTSYPDYMANSIPVNIEWYTQVGSDGLTNNERLMQRWNEWILR
ncbi:ABC transporter substrate-binding protein [Mesorhizobium sp. M0037]|uniref:ABC transporter substrate-binding protein n=1 Tax=unclassified Mesorhizobium TaxID=325217 RepID=UPI003338BA79